MDKKLLKLTLTSGSSRVFNVLDITKTSMNQAIQAAGGPMVDGNLAVKQPAIEVPRLFSVKALNYGIFFKEANLDIPGSSRKKSAIDTILYFPYDAERIMDGGASVSLNDPRFEEVIKDFAHSFGTSSHSNEGNDRAILSVLKQSPSLDPFLLKTNFQKYGVAVPDAYLKISIEEWNAIRDYVRRKLQPMIEFGFQGNGKSINMAQVEELVEKIWDGSDISCLYPLLTVLKISMADADETIFAWKGVTFFEYQYQLKLESIRRFGTWLKEHSAPSDFVQAAMRIQLEGQCEIVKTGLRTAWRRIHDITSQGKQSYEKLFVHKNGAGDFQKFLQETRSHYVELGAAFNKIDHGMEIFEQFNRGQGFRRMRFEELEELFEILMGVLR